MWSELTFARLNVMWCLTARGAHSAPHSAAPASGQDGLCTPAHVSPAPAAQQSQRAFQLQPPRPCYHQLHQPPPQLWPLSCVSPWTCGPLSSHRLLQHPGGGPCGTPACLPACPSFYQGLVEVTINFFFLTYNCYFL